MSRIDREPRSGTQPEIARETEHVVRALDIDMVEVARRTDGTVSFDEQKPFQVTWNSGTIVLSFQSSEGEERLFLNRDTFHRGDQVEEHVGNLGLVMGLDYIALVYPTLDTEDKIEADILTNRSMTRHKLPIRVLSNPLFYEARDLARTIHQEAPATTLS